jgi:hypothetical protein
MKTRRKQKSRVNKISEEELNGLCFKDFLCALTLEEVDIFKAEMHRVGHDTCWTALALGGHKGLMKKREFYFPIMNK